MASICCRSPARPSIFVSVGVNRTVASSSARQRQPHRFEKAVGGDGRMVAGKQHLRHRFTLEHPWPGVLPVFEQAAAEGIAGGRILAAEYARQQSRDRVQDHQGGQFAAGQDIVADGQFFVHVMGAKALVHPFVAAANQGQSLLPGQSGGRGLVEPLSPGREEDDPRSRPLAVHRLEAGGQGFRLHHHALAAAERTVIGHVVAILGVVANVVDRHADLLRAQCPPHHPLVERRDEKFRKNRQDIEPHQESPALTG
jgi:hypothetical protein